MVLREKPTGKLQHSKLMGQSAKYCNLKLKWVVTGKAKVAEIYFKDAVLDSNRLQEYISGVIPLPSMNSGNPDFNQCN